MRHIEKQDLATEVDIALDNLTSGIYAFSGMAKRIAARAKEMEEQESFARELMRKAELRVAELDDRERELVDREAQLREREANIYSLEAQIAGRMRELGELEAWWAKTEKVIDVNASKVPTKVKLNVGGREFITSKSTLLQCKGSFFESLVVGNNLLQDNECFFIDRDPKHFPTILNFLRDGKIRKGVKRGESEELENEFLYYGISPPKQILTQSPSLKEVRLTRQDSPIFESETVLPIALQGVITSWLPNMQFAMIYKASRDGFSAVDFHRHCDHQGATLTIIQSKEKEGGYLFGGYSYESWESPPNNFHKFKSHQNTFIFTLTNPHGIVPTRFFLKQGNPYSLLCNSQYSATFGGGPDIYVASDSNQPSSSSSSSSSPSSYTKFPSSFQDHVGKGRETFTGSLYFTTSEVEVYSVKLIC